MNIFSHVAENLLVLSDYPFAHLLNVPETVNCFIYDFVYLNSSSLFLIPTISKHPVKSRSLNKLYTSSPRIQLTAKASNVSSIETSILLTIADFSYRFLTGIAI